MHIYFLWYISQIVIPSEWISEPGLHFPVEITSGAI